MAAAETGPDLAALFQRQRRAFLQEGPPTAAVRQERLDRLIHLLLAHAEALTAALSADFGHRPKTLSMATDILGLLEPLQHARKHLGRWMQPERRSAGVFRFVGARARIEWQPLGVIGVISPWNFPVTLALHPVGSALAAGNRAMIKVSEHTPRTAALLERAVAESFPDEELAVISGGPAVGAAFCALPFDHLLFTGASAIGKKVQQAAAAHLGAVTLELGGKDPVVVAPDADLERAAARIMLGKTFNAGQVCLAPDYVFVPAGSESAFVAAAQRATAAMYPSLLDNDDYPSLLGERNLVRLRGYLADATERGATVIPINPAHEDFSKQPHHKMPPTLILGATPQMRVLQEEIFGPILPVLPYRDIDEAIAFINERERPLAAYYFGGDTPARRRFLERTTSGGVTINDVLTHGGIEDLPFGGVGHSGLGRYHGREGFCTFSNGRSIAEVGRISTNLVLRPPYGDRLKRLFAYQVESALKAVKKRLKRT